MSLVRPRLREPRRGFGECRATQSLRIGRERTSRSRRGRRRERPGDQDADWAQRPIPLLTIAGSGQP
jgi:hypothetical protein